MIVESASLAGALLGAGVTAAPRRRSRARRPHRRRVARRARPHRASAPGSPQRAAAARRLGVPVVATGDVLLLDPADHDVHRVAVTAAAGELIERMPKTASRLCRGLPGLAGGMGAARARRVRGAGVP